MVKPINPDITEASGNFTYTVPANETFEIKDVFVSFETTDRVFVNHLPWYKRFLIWLFPRMYDIRNWSSDI